MIDSWCHDRREWIHSPSKMIQETLCSSSNDKHNMINRCDMTNIIIHSAVMIYDRKMTGAMIMDLMIGAMIMDLIPYVRKQHLA